MVNFGGEVLNTGHKHSFFNRVLSINVHSYLMDPCSWPAPSLITSQPSHHLGVDINRLISGFIRFRDITPGGPLVWFSNPGDPSFVFKNAVYSFQTALGDGVVAVTATGSLYTCTRPSTDPTSIYAQQLGKWITAFYSTTLACNLTATGRSVTIPILLVVVDAGALYSVTLLSTLICFALGSNGQYVVLDIVTPTISIAFYMVILRIGIAQHPPSMDNTSASLPRVPLSRPENFGQIWKTDACSHPGGTSDRKPPFRRKGRGRGEPSDAEISI
ncbi:hypothetical protein B0H14DRAFT_3143978 [Mycena olivaceomarginata]|nr:hypothetical protein B0H14DRAFT_3143978 [Mycena olivaceomarginata]